MGGWIDGSSPSCPSIGSRLSGCHWSGGAQKGTELSGFETPGVQNTNPRNTRPRRLIWIYRLRRLSGHLHIYESEPTQSCPVQKVSLVRSLNVFFHRGLETFCPTFFLLESVSHSRLCSSILQVILGLSETRRNHSWLAWSLTPPSEASPNER